MKNRLYEVVYFCSETGSAQCHSIRISQWPGRISVRASDPSCWFILRQNLVFGLREQILLFLLLKSNIKQTSVIIKGMSCRWIVMSHYCGLEMVG